jgi:hypothetical protein
MINMKITRMIRSEVTPIVDSEKCSPEAFYEISKEHGRMLDMKEIKKELEKRF